MKKIFLIIVILLPACGNIKTNKFVETRSYMHTFVQIQVIGNNKNKIKLAINSAFNVVAQVETNTSKFIDASDISKINDAEPNEKIPVSKVTYNCLSLAKRVFKQSGGKYDITISPLVELWGFGKNKIKKMPSQKEINNALKRIGYDKIKLIKQENTVSVTTENVEIDLSSIAKGAAVDAAADELLNYGCSNFLINAGGEIRVSSTGEKIWRIGIRLPESNPRTSDIIESDILKLKNKSVATSGSYINFYKSGTNKYSHIIDPQTGKPVNSKVVSVTVIADKCYEADAYATAFFVLPCEESIALANTLSNIECLIIEQTDESTNKFKISHTKNFLQPEGCH